MTLLLHFLLKFTLKYTGVCFVRFTMYTKRDLPRGRGEPIKRVAVLDPNIIHKICINMGFLRLVVFALFAVVLIALGSASPTVQPLQDGYVQLFIATTHYITTPLCEEITSSNHIVLPGSCEFIMHVFRGGLIILATLFPSLE